MASLSYFSGSWVGNGFNPGVEHYWQLQFIALGDVISIMAHAVQRLDRELLVKDVRTHVDPNGNRVALFTVRNTGPSNIPGYSMNVSVVKP